MMLGDLNFQLKQNWVEDESWLKSFVNLEFNRIFKDRINPQLTQVLEIFNSVLPELNHLDNESKVMSDAFLPNYTMYEIDDFHFMIIKSLKD